MKDIFVLQKLNPFWGILAKQKNILGWEPKTSLEELVKEMIDSDKIETKKDMIFKKNIIKN